MQQSLIRPANHPWHIQDDIWNHIHDDWDWAVFHPTCTYLTCSAAWAFKDLDYDRYPGTGYHQRVQPGTLTGAARREARAAALDDFKRLLDLPYPKAIENPATSFVNRAIRPPDQVIQPWQFGDDASKATGLWLDRLPRLVPDPTKRVPGRLVTRPDGKVVERWFNQTDSGQNRLGPTEGRWLQRSLTYPGIARAMAEQWCKDTRPNSEAGINLRTRPHL
ncbi:hypothetical protein [Paracoccus aminovorans]|uniref:hypothetical protein n=1 Tax=Paracoccus aminovorans TaxID=34004 RepID=UPI0011136F55|nr:hypothetical protein [Paracoccus aminovorans]